MLNASRAETALTPLAEARNRFNDINDCLVPQTRAMLERFVADKEMHPRLINTLSMLEHMGSHKIMATQHGAAISQATLRHVTEECHHAFFMKRQAEKAASRQMKYSRDDLVAPLSARMYFQRLEASLARSLRDETNTEATYLFMSMIVELRAIWFYGLYQQVLTRFAHALSLKRLLGEEQSHLTEMAANLEHAGQFAGTRVDDFIETEHRLYLRLLDSLQQSFY